MSRIYKEPKKLNIPKNLTFKMEYKQESYQKIKHKWAEKYLKNCSKFSAIREMQVRIALRFHLNPIRMAKIKWQLMLLRMCVGKRNIYSLLMGVPTGVATMKINMEIPWETENCLTSGSSKTFLRHIPKRLWRYLLPHVYCYSVSDSQKLETP